MDPLTIGLGVIGAATSIAGLFGQSSAEDDKRAAQAGMLRAQQEVIGYQKDENAQRKQAMELDATRRKREMVRQSIVARSTALATTVNQGGFTSSALPGAYGTISGRTNVNELGVNQNQQIGENIFALNDKISTANAKVAQFGTEANAAASKSAEAGAMVGLGTTLMTNAVTIGKIGGNIGGWFGGFGSSGSGSTSNPATPGSLY